jgi:hypothetical protein
LALGFRGSWEGQSASTSFASLGKTIGFNHLNEQLHTIEIGDSSAQAN